MGDDFILSDDEEEKNANFGVQNRSPAESNAT
jgi:hypothetical protein